MTVALPTAMRKMYHVPKGTWYAIGNSTSGLRAARDFGYPWADMDSHITKDGVWMMGHGKYPKDDHFVIPSAIATKYGTTNPRVENMLWADLLKLRTPEVTWRDTRITLRYWRVREILSWMAAHPSISVALEIKQSRPFEQPATFAALRDLAASYGVSRSRLAVMSIPWSSYDNLARFKAANTYFKTVVLPHNLPRPANWDDVKPYVDYYRGSWA